LDTTFQQGDSFIHRSDPRIKILCGFFTAFTIAFLRKVEVSLLAFIISISFIFLSSLSLKKVIKGLFFANFFIAFLWLFVPFSVPGKVIFHIWRWGITDEGVKLSILITLKCNSILMIIITFIATIPLPTLGFALSSLKFPNKFILILLMSYRYINVIFDEYNRFIQAARIRCFNPKTNLHTYRTYAYLIGMVFIRSYERGIRVYQAMLLRGFNGKFYSLRKFYIKKQDVILFIITFMLSMFLLYFDFLYKGTLL